MPGRQIVTGFQVVQAYRENGSVWEAAKALGICGQSVWERLRAMGYKMANERWTEAEIEEVRGLLKTCPIGEIASRLGRPYSAVALKISRLGLRDNTNPVKRTRKLPRGSGFDKKTTKNHMKVLWEYPHGVTRYCRKNGISVDNFVYACQKHFPSDWDEYAKAKGKLPSKPCNYCKRDFYPQNERQASCSRQCQAHKRSDDSYFGGERRNTIGLSEGICQLCKKHVERGLSSHHVLGKKNDPENSYLIALCRGCHQIVGSLAGRLFIEEPEGWESLISLALIRRYADKKDHDAEGVHVYVDIEWTKEEEVEV